MIILHIGLHKAGSTTVQTYLRDNAEALARAGVLYPTIGRIERSIAHHRLAADLRAGAAAPEEWAQIVKLARDNPDKKVVIASEGFQSADPAVVRAVLLEEPVKVFCYHRDAAQRFVSIYSHGVKNGFRDDDFDQVFENQFAMKRTYIGDTLKAWADAFGPENVRVRSLHPSCLAEGELMADVFEVLGLGADAERRLGLRASGSQNVSPGWKALETLRAVYGDLGPGRPDPEVSAAGRTARGALLRRALQAEAKLGLKGKGHYLTGEQMRRVVELETADIAGMKAAGIDARLHPISMDGFQPRAFLPAFDQVPGDEAAALLRELLGAVIRDYVLRPGRAPADAGDGEDEAGAPLKPAAPAHLARRKAKGEGKAAQRTAERAAQRAAKKAAKGKTEASGSGARKAGKARLGLAEGGEPRAKPVKDRPAKERPAKPGKRRKAPAEAVGAPAAAVRPADADKQARQQAKADRKARQASRTAARPAKSEEDKARRKAERRAERLATRKAEKKAKA